VAAGETSIVVPTAARILLVRGRAQISRLTAWRSAAQLVPTEASYQLLAPGGSVLVNHTAFGANLSVDVAGTVSANVGASVLPETLGLGEGYSERWTLTVGGLVRSAVRQAVLARFELHPMVAEAELVEGEYPDLQAALGNYGQTLQAFMDAAWNELLRILAKYGTWADILVEPSDLYDLYRQLVFERVFRSLSKMQEGNERWARLWEHHRDEMRAARDGLRVQVDRDRDGLADSLGMESVVRSVHPNVGPRRTMARPWRW
jgi:hypothetical protein